MRAPSTLAAWARGHPTPVDALLALGLYALSLLSSAAIGDATEVLSPGFSAPESAGVAVALGVTVLPLAFRRRAPLVALLVSTGGFLVARVLAGSIETAVTAISLSLSFYSAAAWGRPGARHVACAAAATAVAVQLVRELTVALPRDVPHESLLDALEFGGNLALIGAMWALGTAISRGRLREAELRERTAALEREREERARRAVFDERVRIARELHDVVAHHVSVMGVQAGAARMVMARDPAAAADALSAIEGSSRQAVAEMHRLLGFLRQEDEADDLAPKPGLAQVRELAELCGGPGLDVRVEVRGSPRPLPATIELSAYRIVQEALTNVVRHAGASRADVRLVYGARSLEVEVVDDGRGSGAPGGMGLGLIGMRERAGLHGGRVDAGPAPGGGFSVRAVLPLGGAAG